MCPPQVTEALDCREASLESSVGCQTACCVDRQAVANVSQGLSMTRGVESRSASFVTGQSTAGAGDSG